MLRITPTVNLLIRIVTAIGLASCDAHYRPTLIRLDPIGSHARRSVVGDVIFYVEEYGSPEKSKRAFDSNMLSEGILPILILIQNRGNGNYTIESSDFRLRGTKTLRPALPDQAAKSAERDLFAPAIGWSLVVPIITIPAAIALSAVDSSTTNRNIQRDFLTKAFPGGKLASGQELSGFIFFHTEKSLSTIPAMTLETSLKNVETKTEVKVSINLPEVILDSQK